MKRKIIVMLAMTLLSAILFVSLTKAQVATGFQVYAWVDKLQYAPGESGTLYITIRNDMASYVYIYNITIIYPWYAYVEDRWEGNETIEVKETVAEDGGVLNKEFKFEVPEDGRAISSSGTPSQIGVYVHTEQLGIEFESALISIANPPLHMAIKDLDMWMTSLTVVAVICTIILAIVVFLSTRKARAPRALAPPPPPPPPPKPKAKAG